MCLDIDAKFESELCGNKCVLVASSKTELESRERADLCFHNVGNAETEARSMKTSVASHTAS